jgi:pimeloyl-ACP methyl ester carboxylesterase
MISTLLLSIVATLAGSTQGPADSLGGLKRGALFGVKVTSLADEDRQRLNLEVGRGALVEDVIPGSTAEAVGLKAGDVIVSIDGAKVEGPSGTIRAISSRKAGESVTVEYRRGDETLKQQVTLKGRPIEPSDAHEVEYGSIVAQAGRLRTIVTRPKGLVGKHPGLLLIQGVGMSSVEGSFGGYREIINDFTARGFVTLRVDKPGCGDSEGGPTDAVDFNSELNGYRQALKALRGRADVDPANVFVFGHSMGGVMAPLLGPEVPVRGIIVYGTIGRTFAEYLPENFRRQAELLDSPAGAVDRQARADATLMTRLFADHLTPKEVLEKYPDLRERVEAIFPDGRTLGGRGLAFYEQLAAKDPGEAWEAFDGHVLVLWGRADFVSLEEDHALIARIINRVQPGNGTFLALDGIDHGFKKATSPRQSMTRGGKPGEFNPSVLEACRAWVEKTLDRPRG